MTWCEWVWGGMGEWVWGGVSGWAKGNRLGEGGKMAEEGKGGREHYK